MSEVDVVGLTVEADSLDTYSSQTLTQTLDLWLSWPQQDREEKEEEQNQ